MGNKIGLSDIKNSLENEEGIKLRRDKGKTSPMRMRLFFYDFFKKGFQFVDVVGFGKSFTESVV
jgi:hypothetical protein